jgi:hypothetical protein
MVQFDFHVGLSLDQLKQSTILCEINIAALYSFLHIEMIEDYLLVMCRTYSVISYVSAIIVEDA